MVKQPIVFIQHMLASVELINKYLEGKSKSDFFSSVQLQDAVIRRLEIIGEAVKNLPEKIVKDFPDLPWKQIAGMRDILIHQYFGVDLDLTWEVIQNELPAFYSQLKTILKTLEK
ncbi:MAG: HepT-like ribonuclease domain-containing protein [Candidatus Heimdallarchaeota archaeon]